MHPEIWTDSPDQRQHTVDTAGVIPLLCSAVADYEDVEGNRSLKDYVSDVSYSILFWVHSGLLAVSEQLVLAAQSRVAMRHDCGKAIPIDAADSISRTFWDKFVPLAIRHKDTHAPQVIIEAMEKKRSLALALANSQLTVDEIEFQLTAIGKEINDSLENDFPKLMVLNRLLSDSANAIQEELREMLAAGEIDGSMIRDIQLQIRETFGNTVEEIAWLAWLKRQYPEQHEKYVAWCAEKQVLVAAQDEFATLGNQYSGLRHEF